MQKLMMLALISACASSPEPPDAGYGVRYFDGGDYYDAPTNTDPGNSGPVSPEPWWKWLPDPSPEGKYVDTK